MSNRGWSQVGSQRDRHQRGRGSQAKTVSLKTNFLRFTPAKHLEISQFDVKIFMKRQHGQWTEEVQRNICNKAQKDFTEIQATNPIVANRKFFNVFCQKFEDNLRVNEFLVRKPLGFDGRSNAFGLNAKPNEKGQRGSDAWGQQTFCVSKEGDVVEHDGGEYRKVIRIAMSFSRTIHFDEKHDRMADSATDQTITESKLEKSMALDVCLKSKGLITSHNIYLVKRALYTDPQSDGTGPAQLELRGSNASLWEGAFLSFRMFRDDIFLNIDQIHKPFWNAGGLPLLSALIFVTEKSRSIIHPDRLNAGPAFHKRDINAANTALAGLRVKTTHDGAHYTIEKFMEVSVRQQEFEYEKRTVSVYDYFRNVKRCKEALNPVLPAVKMVSSAQVHIYLPLEVLVVVPGKTYDKAMGRDTQKRVVQYSTKSPNQKFRELERKAELYRSYVNKDRILGSSNIANSLEEVKGKILNAPSIVLGHGKKQNGCRGWRFGSLREPTSLGKWALVNWCRQNSSANTEFSDKMTSACVENGIVFHNPDVTYGGNISNLSVTFENMKGKGVELIFVLSDNKLDPEIYNKVKYYSDVHIGAQSQVLVSRTLGKRDGMQNTLLKVNAKRGGTNWIASSGQLTGTKGAAREETILILGADVTHPLNAEGGNSYAALVGSTDKNNVKFAGRAVQQDGTQEIIHNIDEMFFNMYGDNSMALKVRDAKHVIMFRDGVSDSQYEHVLKKEVPKLKSAMAKVMPGATLTYIIVTKRHHTKFSDARTREGKELVQNIQSGTVVEEKITISEYPQFYLCSHQGFLGTSKPGMYTVLKNEGGWHTESLQGYILQHCHSFARCAKPIGIIHSVQYAHLLASRAKIHASCHSEYIALNPGRIPDAANDSIPEVHNNLKNAMYFI